MGGPFEAVEADVVALLDQGEIDRAAERIIRGLGAEILRYLRGVADDPDDADDAFSRFAEGLWSSMGSFRRESSVKAWAYRIAWHAALRVLQDPYRRRRDLLRSSQASQLADEVRSRTSLEREAHVDERIERLRRELPPEDRALLILRIDRGLPWNDVARVFAGDGAPVDAAALRKRFERLKQRIRARAIAEGIVGG
jgi:RNA polymerase sigma-70 factor (ECF subfamily)